MRRTYYARGRVEWALLVELTTPFRYVTSYTSPEMLLSICIIRRSNSSQPRLFCVPMHVIDHV